MGLREEFAKLNVEELKALWREQENVDVELSVENDSEAHLDAVGTVARNAEAYPVIIELGKFIALQLNLAGHPVEESKGALYAADSIAYALRIHDEQQMLRSSLEEEQE